VKVFVSHSSHDDVAVRSLADDLVRGHQQVWLDQDLGGGDPWWAEILAQVRACTVFVFALSDNSLRSKPCRAELDYAEALELPILPVQIGHVSNYRTDPIFTKHLVDYRDSTGSSGMAVVAALYERATGRADLPDPLPEPPVIPYEYLLRLGAAIRGSTDLARSAQLSMLFELRTALDDEDDAKVCDDIRGLLRILRARRDVIHAVAGEIDTILGNNSAEPAPIGEATPRDHSDSTVATRVETPNHDTMATPDRGVTAEHDPAAAPESEAADNLGPLGSRAAAQPSAEAAEITPPDRTTSHLGAAEEAATDIPMGTDKPATGETPVPAPAAQDGQHHKPLPVALRRKPWLLIGGAAVAVLAVVIGLVVWLANPSNLVNPSNAVELSVLDNGVYVGSSAAPTTIDVFDEPICAPCGVFISSYSNAIQNAVDAKKIAVRFHLLNFQDDKSASRDYSTRAVAATYCVAAQNDPKMYMAFYTGLFATGFQPQENGSTDRTDAELAHLAQSVGAPSSVTSCIESGDDVSTAKTKAGKDSSTLKTGTPAVFDGTRKIDTSKSGWLDNLH
jgi:protein-disulfide isomerase